MRLGEVLKERGQQLTLLNAGEAWQVSAMDALRKFAQERKEFTAEQFRYEWLSGGNGYEPPTHKAWGALFTAAAKADVIRHTGRYVKAQSAKTHGHPVAVWEAA